MAERASVIFIREWEQQMSSSGCCGRLEGDFLTRGGEPVFPERRAVMESLGPLYCDVRRRYGARAEVQVIDPRNFVGLLALLVRDFWAYRVGARDVLRTLTRLPTPRRGGEREGVLERVARARRPPSGPGRCGGGASGSGEGLRTVRAGAPPCARLKRGARGARSGSRPGSSPCRPRPPSKGSRTPLRRAPRRQP